MKQPSLLGIAKKAASDKAHRFQNLIGLLSAGYLLACWRLINKRAACGVDRQDARTYEQNLEEHVGALVEAVRGGWYRAKLVLRRYIIRAAPGSPSEGPLGTSENQEKIG